MTLHSTRLASAALLLALTAPAQADVTVNLEVRELTIELHDIDPNDGRAPGVAFRDSAKGSSTDVSASVRADRPKGDEASDRAQSAVMFAPLHASASTLRGRSWADVVGGLDSGGPLFSLGGHIVGNPLLPSVQAGAGIRLVNELDSFVLQPGTAMTVRMFARIESSTTIGTTPMKGGRNYEEGSYSLIGLGVNEWPMTSPTRQVDSLVLNVADVAQVASVSQWLTVTLRNDTAAPLTGQMELRGGFGLSALSPVPEPASALLWLAGLGALGLRARRGIAASTAR